MRIFYQLTAITLLILASSFCSDCPAGKKPATIKIDKIESYRKVKKIVNWLSWDDLSQALYEKPKKIMIQIGAPWCGWCKRMEYVTLEEPEIVDALNTDFYCLKLNGETNEEIYFNGKTYKLDPNFTKRRNGVHELAISLLGKNIIYPSTIFLTTDYKIIKIRRGSCSTENFLNLLEEIAE